MPIFRVRYTGPLEEDYEADDQLQAEEAFRDRHSENLTSEELDANGKSAADYAAEEDAAEYFEG